MLDHAARPTEQSPPGKMGGSQFVALGRDIKLSHSVFALPFALLATFLAAGSTGTCPSVVQLVLIVICMVLARTLAMTINRLADADIDVKNPRTAGRALPSGRLNKRFAKLTALGCAAGFVVACFGFYIRDDNFWPVLLAPLVLGYLAGYSFTKRFTWLCHVYLGSALALSPLAAVIAIEPGYLAGYPAQLLVGLVLCWVAGFDIIYALQDIEVDRSEGLFSMPACLGAEAALWISRLLHLLVVVALILLWRSSAQLGPFFALAGAVTAGLLILEHALVWGSKTHRIHIAFLTINGVISLLLGAAGIVDVIQYLA